jgi:hypothetical protein
VFSIQFSVFSDCGSAERVLRNGLTGAVAVKCMILTDCSAKQ